MKFLIPTTRLSLAQNRFRVRYITLALMMAFLPALIAFPLGAHAVASRTEVFTFRPGGQVRVENSRGSTSVEVWDDQSVRIIAEKKGPANTTLDPSDIILMSAQDTILVQCKQTAQPGRIDLIISVPAQAHLQITGGQWPVDVSGSLVSAVVETTTGNISYRIPKSENARVVMHSTRGTVRSTVPLEVTDKAGQQSLQGRIGDGSAPIILNSQSGVITLSPSPYSSPIARATRQSSSPQSSNAQSGGPLAMGNQTSTRQPAANTPVDSRPSFGRGTSGPSYRPSSVPPDSQANQNDNAADNGPGSSQSGGGSINIGGTNNSQDNDTHYSAGPFGRPRHEKIESTGSVGMRARIIPSGVPLGNSRNNGGSIYDDNRDDSRLRGVPNSGTARPDISGNSSGQPLPDQAGRRTASGPSRGSRDDSPAFDDDEETRPEAGTANPRASSPPVLRRGNNVDSSTATAADRSDSNENSGDEETVKLDAALVNLNVAATDRSGVALANLSKDDFEVYENGERQSIEFFKASTSPYNLVLILDLSGSIKDKLDIIKSAALRFIEEVGKEDKIAVLTFTDEVRVISQFTANRDLLRKRVKSIEKPDGGTAFYEAMWFALVDTLRGTAGQRNAIVVLTDGVDSSLDRYNPFPTRVTFDKLARRLEESDSIVFPIYLDTEYEETFRNGGGVAEAYSIARDQLERIAELTGGQMFRAQEAKDLSGVYKKVAAALRTVYSIGYYPANSERDGTFRRVRVSVNRPSAAVRTRKGYYAK